MRTAVAQRVPGVAAATAVPDPIGQAMADLQAELGGHCLFETEDGRVVSHAVGPDAPDPVVRAVLERSSRCLHAAVTRRRHVALAPGHGTQALQLPGTDGASLVPVVAAGERLGWLWWLGYATLPDFGALSAAAARVGRAASLVAGDADDGWHGWLTGARAGAPGTTGASAVVVVAASSADTSPAQLAGLLRRAAGQNPSSDLRVDVTTVDDTAFLVLTGPRDLPADRMTGHVDLLLDATGVPVLAGASDPVSPQQPGVSARAQAGLVLEAAGRPGRCLTPAMARPHLLLRHVSDALARTAALGPDPLAPLLEYDEKRSTGLATTLLAWLDAQGDVAVAAELMQLHRNTLRYRLGRALELLGSDLADASARLEVHLLLRHALR